MMKTDKIITVIEKGLNIADKGYDLIKQVSSIAVVIFQIVSEIAVLTKDSKENDNKEG